MTKTETAFLTLVRAALHEQKPADPGLSPEEWEELLRLAERHKLLPLTLDAAVALPSCRAALKASAVPPRHSERSAAESKNPSPPVQSLPLEERAVRRTASFYPQLRSSAAEMGSFAQVSPQATDEVASRSQPAPDWKNTALEQAARQAVQENEFLNAILELQKRGLDPVVMKGPVCRALYPKPLLRPSVDDDLLIPDGAGEAYHAALLELGLSADDPAADPATAWELSYHKPESPLYLELHKRLFDPGSGAFRGFNEPFEGALDRAVPVQIQDVTLKTLAPTDHLLFLLLHAFKHFLFSGFGVRIIADVCLFTWHYGEEIDFARVRELCAERRAERFAAALYRIGEQWLDLPIPEPFAVLDADPAELLEDVLASGLHGAEIDRLHSAAITLGAVEDHNAGRAPSGGLAKTLFPSVKKLSGRYPWLEKRPWLLPAAWISRIGSYLKERGKYGEQSPTASLRIGSERVKLLERYGIIDE